jgi:hypothetical protein
VTETPREREESARVRRRWLNLGELLAIVAVVISALTLWNGYRERTNTEAERHADAMRTSKVATILVLHAAPEHDGRTLTLTPKVDSQSIQSQTIAFPSMLGLDPIDTTGDARIEKSWFESALVKARKDAGASHDRPGDARLPVMITSHFLIDGEPATDRALFEIGYVANRAFLTGTTIRLKGLSRVEAAKDETSGKTRLDALATSTFK